MPRATYRVQLNADLGFAEAGDLAPYLAELGVSHLYCSPYLQAAPGSTHGYDVVDPQALNVELGGAPAHAAMVGALRDAGLGHVLDIVPNHMAVAPTNRWWWDVLENGPSSRYARFFDIDWEGTGQEKSAWTVLVPVLGDHYGRVLEAGDLRVARTGGTFVVRYAEAELPLSPRTVDGLLAAAARQAGSPALAEVAEGMGALPDARLTDPEAVRERHDRKDRLAADLHRLCEADPAVAKAVDAEVATLDADHDRLDELLRRQNYRLAHWRTASEELDYRRFFSIETLVGVRVEEPEVFAETHALILELVRDGTIDGLRIDHVDGLADPGRYLRDLDEATGGRWTVVEKILEPGEALPDWPVAGTSGYDFATRVNDLFVETANEAAMTACYESFTGERASYDDVVHAAKHQVMAGELRAEVDRLTGSLAAVCDAHRRHRDHTRRALRHAVREVVAAFGVYRTYVTPARPASAADRARIAAALEGAARRRPDLDAELLELIGEAAAGDIATPEAAELAQRLQQLTGPVMAKGVEDTAFYRYNRLVSLNEVGGSPGVFGRPVAAFHDATAVAAARWPATMNTLSTHDTKRSADVRARLNVLSELPEAWEEAVHRWAHRNDRHRVGGWPDRNAEYLLYQTLVGAWPLDAERVVAFMAKATREAKVHTSWTDPVADYDEAVQRFAAAVRADDAFVADLEGFLAEHRIVERGRQSSLAQVALLLTSPGVPDLYQGDELWDLSLVDPDNRRPVDHELRRRLLGERRATPGAPPPDVADDELGRAKLHLVHRLLAHRRAHPDLFASSTYEPLDAGDGTVAFARDGIVTVVPCRTGADRAAAADVALPPGRWVDLLTGMRVAGGHQPVAGLLAGFPVSVLAREGS